MKAFVQTLVAWGPFGVFLLAVLDSAGIPLPGGVDALMVLLGAKTGPAAYWAAGAAVLGSTAGNLILFYLARKGGEAYLARHTLSPRSQRFQRWFQHYGLLTIFIPGVLPIPLPLKVFVISAAVTGVKLGAFLAAVVAARIPRYFGLAYLGIQLGTDSTSWLKQHAWHLTLIAVALFAVLFGVIKLADRMRGSAEAIGPQ